MNGRIDIRREEVESSKTIFTVVLLLVVDCSLVSLTLK